MTLRVDELLRNWLRSRDTGSAILEFVILAIPLFLPLVLYIYSINSAAQDASDIQNLARQAARAFVTSPSESLASVRANQVLDFYQSQILPSHGSSRTLHLRIDCEFHPCLTPNGKVVLHVSESPGSISASATQIVDSWRNSE